MVIGVVAMTIQIGERLKQARIKAGLSLREVARRLDTNHSYLSRVENDYVIPSLETVQNLANFYGVSLSELFSSEVDNSQSSFPDNSQSSSNEKIMINKLNEISDTLKQIQRNQIPSEWLEVIEYCQKENLNPKVVLEALKTIVGISKELK
jgi:transcriptional regulator with XRE-family HTH domain